LKSNTYLKDYDNRFRYQKSNPSHYNFTLEEQRRIRYNLCNCTTCDYLTDLFPILELEPQLKNVIFLDRTVEECLKLLAGLFSKHVEQFTKKGIYVGFSWEFLALAFIRTFRYLFLIIKSVSFIRNFRISYRKFLANDKSPARRIGQIDNRGSHFTCYVLAEAISSSN
jgi:isocitrate dehydrogenase